MWLVGTNRTVTLLDNIKSVVPLLCVISFLILPGLGNLLINGSFDTFSVYGSIVARFTSSIPDKISSAVGKLIFSSSGPCTTITILPVVEACFTMLFINSRGIISANCLYVSKVYSMLGMGVFSKK